MQKAERELLEEKFKGVYLHQQANFDLMNEKLQQIHAQTLLTNGRLTKAEKETRVIRFFESKPIYFFLILIGLLVLVSYLDLQDLLKLL